MGFSSVEDFYLFYKSISTGATYYLMGWTLATNSKA
jgi:hypothetical protein